MFKRKHIHKPINKPLVYMPEEGTFSKIKIEVHGIEKFTKTEQRKFLDAISLGVRVLNSMEFMNMVSNYTFSEDRSMSGEQIYNLLCSGKDLYNAENDNDIDVFVTMYDNFWTGTIGYTFPNTFKTWINRKFFSNFDESKILGNVIHEAMHNFGFEHKDYKNRFNSVPYKVGYLARDLGKRIMEGETLTPLKAV